MKYKVIIVLLLLIGQKAFLQNAYQRVRIDLQTYDISTIASTGICIDHADYRKGTYIIADLSYQEVKTLEKAGIAYVTEVKDLKKFYKAQLKQEPSNRAITYENACRQPKNYPTPNYFKLGSMGGYFTYEEYLAAMDSMVKLYPDLITIADTLAYRTHEGRPILCFVIGDKDSMNEPKLLYNAIHHAREPASLSNIIFYMWYLLERYSIDPEVKYLVDNTQMYFVPCINPDGYIYNENTDPDGGGLWRKNRRNHGGHYGVDLNRNYGFNWGFNNQGSSSSSQSETYRGDSAFSEPETKSMRALCLANNFKIALNYHTYGDLLIYPWGYDYSLYTPDSMEFVEMSRLLTRDNRFKYGTGDQTVGYLTNGDSDDWMYGEQNEKTKIFSMTPELGPRRYGFWPPSSEIIPICKTAMHQNLMAAHMLLGYAQLKDHSSTYLDNKIGYLNYRVKTWGLTDSMNYTFEFVPITHNISFPNSNKVYDNVKSFDAILDSVAYNIETEAVDESIVFEVIVSNGKYEYRDTITKHYVEHFLAFYDPFNNLDNWIVNNGLWGIDSNFLHSNPNQNYYNTNENSSITTKNIISLKQAQTAFLQLNLKWDIEANFDYLQIQISTDNINWTSLCGKYSRQGGQDQAQNEPLYDGSSNGFVWEEINLNDYVGQNIYLRLYLRSDYGVSAAGIAINELLLSVTGDTSIAINEIENGYYLSQNYPNPANGYTYINYAVKDIQDCTLNLYDVTGKLCLSKSINQRNGHIIIQTANLGKGLYKYCIEDKAGRSEIKSLIIP